MSRCPCGNANLENCCLPLIENKKNAETPEALMRSRYTAYVLNRLDYIEQTMRGPALANYKINPNHHNNILFIKLEVLRATEQIPKGEVEFCAYYLAHNKLDVLHEISEFIFVDEKWYYTNGQLVKEKNYPQEIGRNDLCPCGSTKKFKKCCAL